MKGSPPGAVSRCSHKKEPHKIGYGRVSTEDQNLGLQLDALRRENCCIIFRDCGYSGVASNRPGLTDALAALTPGDVLITWKLDRLGRSLAELITIIGELECRQIGFRSLSESIDTTTAGGRLIFHVMGALAEFERSLISERTRAGMASARARGVTLGRPSILTEQQISTARGLLADSQGTMAEIAAVFGVSRSTLARALAQDSPA